MITAKEAYGILVRKIDKSKISKCYEYDSAFVFDISTPIGSKKVLNNAVCVDKKSGNVTDFKPFRMPIDEYRRGKEVANYV